MPPSKTRYITACQQVLALAVVLAALTPAASVVSLDIVSEGPSVVGSGRVEGHLSAYTRASARKSVVPAEVVDPTVTEYPLTAATGTKTTSRATLGALQARTKVGASPASTQVTSLPQPVTGYGAVGVTWQHGVQVPASTISFEARTLTGDVWSDWTPMDYDDDHGPDPESAEGRHARPGTDELLVGEVDQVQIRSEITGDVVPADMKLAVIDPGVAAETTEELAAIDTAELDGAGGAPAALALGAETDGQDGQAADALDLRAATYTPKPVIYSRAQWGADEGMREKSSLHYFEVHAGFVHHTVNSNDYTRAEVPGILRSIYAYHTQSKGWSDIGYNYLVDRFGRIWEGRFGGVDRPVVGAHTLGYNDYAFAMSAIGNYEIHRPSKATIQAYGALFAWKLSLHGVDASSTNQWVGTKSFRAINGHRDAGSTACPGKYLYAKLPQIRELAAEAQRGWAGRELESDLASTAHPDLIVRRASDGQGFVIPTGGMTRFGSAETVSTGWSGVDTVLATPDVTGDGKSDLVVRVADTVEVRPGDGAGGFGAATKPTDAFAGHDLLTAVGDLNGDGRNDLVARWPTTGRLDAYLGGGNGGFSRTQLGTVWGGYTQLVGPGDVNGDRLPDLLARDADGKLWLHPGTATTGFGTRVEVAGPWRKYDTITGFGDYGRDGIADLVVRRADNGYGFVLPGRGDGTFGHRIGPLPRLRGVTGLTGGGNLAGNPAPDLLARRGGRLVLLRNAGTFDTGKPIATGADLSTTDLLLNAGDWDRDGLGDIITRNRATGTLYVRRGDGKGHFKEAVSIGRGFGNVGLLAAVGDMTGDGWPDLMGQPAGADMRIYPGRGRQGLKASYVAHSRIAATRQIAVGRWDGDGAPDSLFRDGSRLSVYPGNGPGGLTGAESLGLDLTPYDWVIGVSDVNLTGHPDVIVRAKSSGFLWLLQATGDGFAERRFIGEGMKAYDLAG